MYLICWWIELVGDKLLCFLKNTFNICVSPSGWMGVEKFTETCLVYGYLSSLQCRSNLEISVITYVSNSWGWGDIYCELDTRTMSNRNNKHCITMLLRQLEMDTGKFRRSTENFNNHICWFTYSNVILSFFLISDQQTIFFFIWICCIEDSDTE